MASLDRAVMSIYMARKLRPASGGGCGGDELSVTKPFRIPLRRPSVRYPTRWWPASLGAGSRESGCACRKPPVWKAGL